MLTVTRLKRKPKHFYTFIGFTVLQFEEVLLEVERHYSQFRTARLRDPARQRAEGAGRPYRLLEDRLLLTLMFLRLNLTHTLLGYFFNFLDRTAPRGACPPVGPVRVLDKVAPSGPVRLDQSNIGREIWHRMRPTLVALPTPLQDRLFDPRPALERAIQTLAELLERHFRVW